MATSGAFALSTAPPAGTENLQAARMCAEASPDKLSKLSHEQCDVVRRDQLAGLVSDARVRAQLAARRWQEVSPTVLVLHNGPPNIEQQRWAAVLGAGDDAALAGRTALSLAGMQRWEDEVIHVLVPMGNRMPALRGVRMVLHQSRNLQDWQILDSAPRRTTVARSAVDAATWSRSPRTAAGIVTAVVQQGLTTVPLLAEALEVAGPIRHAPLLRETLGDIEGGAQSLAESDFGKLCRRFELPEPERQVVRLDSNGRRRYLDALLIGPDDREVGVEIDGAHHMQADQWDRDIDRSNDISIGGTLVLRFTATTIRTQPERVAAQLRRALGIERV